MLFYQPAYSKPLFREVALNLLLHKPEKCPNIVQMLDWFEVGTTRAIVMEYTQSCITLRDFVSCQFVKETLTRHFMRQAVIAAKHWLDHGVSRGGLSLANILINTETMQLKVIDFGGGHLISTVNDPNSGYLGKFLCCHRIKP